jgi:hypothetical protein
MPIENHWIQRPSLLRLRYRGEVTAEEMDQHSRDIMPLVEARRLYILIDMSDVTSMPRNLVNVSYRAENLIRFIKYPNTRAFAFVGLSTLTRLTIEMVMHNQVVAMFDEFDEAVAFLRERQEQDSEA